MNELDNCSGDYQIRDCTRHADPQFASSAVTDLRRGTDHAFSTAVPVHAGCSVANQHSQVSMATVVLPPMCVSRDATPQFSAVSVETSDVHPPPVDVDRANCTMLNSLDREIQLSVQSTIDSPMVVDMDDLKDVKDSSDVTCSGACDNRPSGGPEAPLAG